MCAPACAHDLQNQIWNAKVLVLERQGKDSYVLALASPDQHFLDGAPLELCLPLDGAQIATHGDREVSPCLPACLPPSLPPSRPLGAWLRSIGCLATVLGLVDSGRPEP